MKKIVQLINLGRADYATAYAMQRKLHKQLVATVTQPHPNTSARRNQLIVVEHEPVYTIGIRDKNYDQDLESKLRNLGADFVRTDRGGLITFHGPGNST